MLAFHHFDKILEKISFEEERFIWLMVSEVSVHVGLAWLFLGERVRWRTAAHLMVDRKQRERAQFFNKAPPPRTQAMNPQMD
jgi:hypothetical protein